MQSLPTKRGLKRNQHNAYRLHTKQPLGIDVDAAQLCAEMKEIGRRTDALPTIHQVTSVDQTLRQPRIRRAKLRSVIDGYELLTADPTGENDRSGA
jgi:hypothetical protein